MITFDNQGDTENVKVAGESELIPLKRCKTLAFVKLKEGWLIQIDTQKTFISTNKNSRFATITKKIT